LLIGADADAVSANVTINGKEYTSTEKVNGQFVLQIPTLPNGPHPYTVVVKYAAGNQSQPFNGSLTVMTDVQPPGNLVLKDLTLIEDSGIENDFLTNKQELQFSGEVEGFDSDTQRFLVQVLNDAGDVLSMAYVKPDAAGQWAFGNRSQVLGQDTETTPYLIKTSVVDLAGNVLKSTSQSFLVDLQDPVISYVGTGGSGQSSFTVTSLSASEKGTFASGAFYLNSSPTQLTGTSFAPGDFTLSFTDLAGNFASFNNTTQDWLFPNVNVSLNQGPSAGAFIYLTGPVGQYSLGAHLVTLDVSSLYDTHPTVGEKAAINRISSTGGDHVITISMDDVLALGVKNSFTASGHLQIRIDGDATDQVFMDNKMGTSSDLHWVSQAATTLDGHQYSVYANSDLGLELFIQQSLQVTAVL
jgi:hypothetical protein